MASPAPEFLRPWGRNTQRVDDLSRFCCQNLDCPLHGQRDVDNLSVCDRYGKHQPIRLLYCKACESRFSERKGTSLFHSCLPQEKAVLEHLVEGNGIRQTERLVRVHRDTHSSIKAAQPAAPSRALAMVASPR
jgi:transposase-like protein